MKNLLSKAIFAVLLLSLASCGPKQAAEESAAEETATTEVPAATTSGEGYTITVINAEPASPRKEMKGSIGAVNITVNYGSPKAKGRTLFGEGGLAPYGKVWRTGANEQTTIEFSGPVTIGATAVPAGKYGLFTIPGDQMWTIIINKSTDLWGDNGYSEGNDLVRVAVKPQTGEFSEEMDFVIEGDAVVLKWGATKAPLKVKAG